MRIVSGMRNHVLPVANTTPISVEPRPVAKQPSAPYVVLCEVGADDNAARLRQVPVDHHLVTDAFREQIGDRVLHAELADHSMQLSGRNGVGRHDVVEAENDAARVPQRRLQLPERLDRKWSRDVMRHGDIHRGDNGVTGVHRTAEPAAEDFLGQCSHLDLLCPSPADDQGVEGFAVQRAVITAALHLGGKSPQAFVIKLDAER